MIGLGAKYLTAAGFGRYRITAASLGNLDLLGTLGWLSKAARQAILAAFGQNDGWQVIKATNAYLNQLAASDRDKATALAGFINEDPMMVCSIVDTPKTRWLKGDGTAYINTGVYATNGTNFKFGYRMRNITASLTSNGIGSGDSFYIGVISSKIYYSKTYGDINTGVSVDATHDYEMYVDNIIGKVYAYDFTLGQEVANISFTTATKNIDRPILLYTYATSKTGHTNTRNIWMSKAYIYDSNGVLRDLVPFLKKDGENEIPCFLDLSAIGVEGKQLYYYNAASSGAFTIGETDTPSTP